MPRDAETRVSSYPTRYRGFRFRSRLEATWAAFFDGVNAAWAGAKNALQWQPVPRWNHS
jgi:hypothetical protein